MAGLNATNTLLLHIKLEGIPQPDLEFKFHPDRRWRFDLAWPAAYARNKGVAVEIDGGVWINGRHNRGSGYIKDMEKLNAAAELGWRVFRFTPQMVYDGQAIQLLKRVLL